MLRIVWNDSSLYPLMDSTPQGARKAVRLYPWIIAAPLNARDMSQTHPAMTITRMNAGVEPPWMALRRVLAGSI